MKAYLLYLGIPLVSLCLMLLAFCQVSRSRNHDSRPSVKDGAEAAKSGSGGSPSAGPFGGRNPSDVPLSGGNPPDAPFDQMRHRMVERQIRARGVRDERVLAAMEKVPRHLFVGEALQSEAYSDGPLPIGHDQTISQPYIVALMTALAKPKPNARALDVGTGSGYQAAVLAELVAQVYSIEIICPLAEEAAARLKRLGYGNVEVRCGDGYRGWIEHAPFDLIILAAAPDHVPQALIEQLAPGGRLVLPVGEEEQDLIVVEKRQDGTITRHNVLPVRFVPMTGEAEDRKQ